MQSQLDELFSKIFKTPFYWAKDSIFKILLLLAVIYVFVFPVVEWLHENVKKIPIIEIATSAFNLFVNNVSIVEFVIIIGLLGSIVTIGYVIKEINKNKVVKDNFNHGLNLWSTPFNAGWSIQKCSDANGNMLVVAKSNTSGILKASHNWYDYEFSFLTKISKKNEGKIRLVIRADNGTNGVVFELTKTSLSPHLLYNGKLIRDKHNESKFSLVLNENVWFKVTTIVKGNDVEIKVGEENRVHYKLSTLSLNIEESLLNKYDTEDLTLEDLRESDKKWLSSIKKALDLHGQARKLKDPEQKKLKEKEADLAFDAVPNNMTRISIDNSKGTVGFISPREDRFYIRNVKVEKI